MPLAILSMLSLDAAMRLTRLRTEYLTDPAAVNTTRPRFSWEMLDSRYGAKQNAYEIEVKTGGQTVWNSGRVDSASTTQIEYDGQPLLSHQKCEWKVRAWDKDNMPTPWVTAKFGVGKLSPEDWSAKWISNADPLPEVKPAHNGFHSEIELTQNKPKWVQVDLGYTRKIDRIRLWPANPFDISPRRPGFLFPLRWKVEACDEPTFSQPRLLVDLTDKDFPNPTDRPVEFSTPEEHGRYVRVSVTKLTERDPGHFGFALAEFDVMDAETNIAKGVEVTASDSVENRNWGVKRLVDGDRFGHGIEGLDSLPVTNLRRKLTLSKAVKSATAYTTALGLYQFAINGKQPDDRLLAPEWTDYHSRVQYQAYDVTKLLKSGTNWLSAVLGDGWYAGRIGMAQGLDPRGYPRAVYGRKTWFLAQIDIEYTDGTKESVVTNEAWRATTSDTLRTSDIYDGEIWDWNAQNIQQWEEWPRVEVSKEVPGGHKPLLIAQTNEPIRVVERLKPVSVTEPKPGIYVLDMGQNMVGRIQAKLAAKAGGAINFQYAEMLSDDGTVYTDNLRGAPQRDRFVMIACKPEGDIKVGFSTLFTYHGFRYVQIEGLSVKPKPADVTGEVFCSSSPESTTFECSDPMVNKLWQNIFWTQRANLMSTPTDCPQRDERLGWMGDIQAFGQTAYFNMDMAGFFTKWLPDVRDAQAEDGRYPDFAPHPYGKNDRFNGVPGWGDAGVVCAWTHYWNTDDRRLLREHIESAKKWVRWIASKNPDYLWVNERHNDYGDWLNGDTLRRDGWDSTGSEVPKEVFATMMWYQSAHMVSEMATVLGHRDSELYAEMSGNIRAAFQKAYLQPDGGLKGDTQAGYALALWLDLIPLDTVKKSFAKLVQTIERRNGALTTGFHSTYPLMHVLTKMGRTDLAYKLLLNRGFPSWGYTIDNGATTIWERWDGYVKGRGFQDPGMNSFNHWALGSVGQWMMESLVGISAAQPGFKVIEFSPRPGPGVEWAKASYRSHAGTIYSEWKKRSDGVWFKFIVPPGALAKVDLGANSDRVKILAGEEHVQKSKGTFTVESGTYEFLLSD